MATVLSVFSLLFLGSLLSSALTFPLTTLGTGTGGPVPGSTRSLRPELWIPVFLALAVPCYLVGRRMFQRLDL